MAVMAEQDANPASTDRIRLLVADYGPTRMGVRLALQDECKVCAEAENVDQAIVAAEREQPDLCLIGSELPGGAINAVRGVVEVAPHAAVLILSPGDALDSVLSMIQAGAVGCVSGSADPSGLRRVVRAVAAGEAAMPRRMVLDLIRELQRSAQGGSGLTTREAEVLTMLRSGASTGEIASHLNISPVTVRRHISALVQKVGVADRTALADPHLR